MDDQVRQPQSANPSADGGWGAVQDALAQALGMAVGRCDRATPRDCASVSLDSPICHLLRQHPEAAVRCAEQCDEGIEMSMRTGRTQLFQCHARLSVFITLPDLPNGTRHPHSQALIGGRTFLSYEEVHRFRAYADELGLPTEAVEALIPDIRVVTLARVKEALEQVRTVAGAVMALERQLGESREQASRLRYLMEVFGGLEGESPEELANAALNGPAVVFDATAGVVLERPSGSDRYVVTSVFPGKGSAFSGDALGGLEIAATGWLDRAAQGESGSRFDSIYDMLRAGFPAETTGVELFPFSTPGHTRVVVLLNTPLEDDARVAITLYVRHAALLTERHSAQLHGEDDTLGGIPEIAPALWETDDYDALCAGVLKGATACLEAEQGSVMLLDDKQESLSIRAIQGVNIKYVEYVKLRRGEGIAGIVLERGEPLLVEDIAEHPEFRSGIRARYRGRSFLSVPIQLNDLSLGVINVTDKRGGGVFTRRDLRRLLAISHQAALAIDRIRTREQTEELRRATMTDYRSGLLNAQAFDQRLQEEVERAQRYPYASPLSLLVVDIDHFKHINDNFDYLAGDDCIVACARLLQAGTRTIDSVFRRGGEEFTVILPHTGREAAVKLAERLRQSIEDHRVITPHAPHPLSFTVSGGVATFPEDGESAMGLFQRATQALHVAKKTGRNKVLPLPPNLPV
ncbi:MAG: diguanylate cyclase [Nitrospirota bacterium]|nr:diguanylate cyclase [Nitrospirota bacterium]